MSRCSAGGGEPDVPSAPLRGSGGLHTPCLPGKADRRRPSRRRDPRFTSRHAEVVLTTGRTHRLQGRAGKDGPSERSAKKAACKGPDKPKSSRLPAGTQARSPRNQGMVQVGGTTQERGAIDARAAWAQARRAGQDLAGGGAQRSPRKAVSSWPQPRRRVRCCHRGTYLSPIRGSVGGGLADRGLTPTATSSPAVPASRGPWTLPAAYTWCDPKRTLSEPCRNELYNPENPWPILTRLSAAGLDPPRDSMPGQRGSRPSSRISPPRPTPRDPRRRRENKPVPFS